MRSTQVNILSALIVLIIIIGWYFEGISLAFLIPVVIIYFSITIVGSANIQLNYYFKSYCVGANNKREIVLTFDDGPNPELTSKLLELLSSYDAIATFFCTGKNAVSYPHLIEEISKQGHIVGNHTYGHSKVFDLFSSSHMNKEIEQTNTIINEIIGKYPMLFRPPYGVTNPMLRKALKKTNMISIGWSLRSLDTVKKSEDVISKLKSKTNSGDIVLFHDTIDQTVSIVEDYLIWLKENNYKVVSLTSLLKIPAYED